MSGTSSEPNNWIFTAQTTGGSLGVYLPATMLYQGVGLVRGLVLAWLLVDQLGQYYLASLVLLIINVLAPLISLGLPAAVTRYLPAHESRHRLRKFLLHACLAIGSISSLASIVLLVVGNRFGHVVFGPDASQLVLPTVACVWATVAYLGVVAILRGLRFFRALSLLEMVNRLAFLGLVVLAVLVIAPSAHVVIYSYFAALVLALVLFGGPLVRCIKYLPDQAMPVSPGSTLSRMLSFGIWAAMAGVVWQGMQICSLWYLSNVTADGAVLDAFAGARMLGQLVTISFVAIAGVVMTQVNKLWEDKLEAIADRQLDLYTKLATLGMLTAGLCMVLAGSLLFKMLPPHQAAGLKILPQMLVFCLLTGVLSFLAIHFTLIEKTRLMLWCWIPGLFVNIILMVRWCIGQYVLEGAANSAAVAVAVATVITLALTQAERKKVNLGILIVVAGTGLLLCRPIPALVGLAALGGVAIFTRLIFSVDQKQFIVQQVRRLEKKVLSR